MAREVSLVAVVGTGRPDSARETISSMGHTAVDVALLDHPVDPPRMLMVRCSRPGRRAVGRLTAPTRAVNLRD
jgi:hypothetical protein